MVDPAFYNIRFFCYGIIIGIDLEVDFPLCSNVVDLYIGLEEKTLLKLCKDEVAADNCNPTDFGFASIARDLSDVTGRREIK